MLIKGFNLEQHQSYEKVHDDGNKNNLPLLPEKGEKIQIQGATNDVSDK